MTIRSVSERLTKRLVKRTFPLLCPNDPTRIRRRYDVCVALRVAVKILGQKPASTKPFSIYPCTPPQWIRKAKTNPSTRFI